MATPQPSVLDTSINTTDSKIQSENNFEIDLSSNYNCSICFRVMINCSIIPCGHEFCHDCIRLVTPPKCPLCRLVYTYTSIVPSYKTSIIIDKLPVKCKFEACKHMGTRQNIHLHEESCEFNTKTKLIAELTELKFLVQCKISQIRQIDPKFEDILLYEFTDKN